jgi:cell wall-associated NlpC family hydrolase
MASTASGRGYWLFAGDGGVFAYGDARFYGSTGAVRLARPIVGMASTSDGQGYWEVASDGGVFPFGTAQFAGSLGGHGAGETVEKLVPARHGSGYWEVASDGDIYPFGSAGNENVPTVAVLHEINGPGDVAVEWAMAQLGKPYLWGGAGPNAFDCSGLVMRAWEAAGVSIPRVAADQYNVGTHVAISQLRPGDLVFWADNPAQPATIHHVAMYLGGDHMVNAPYTGQVVRTDWIGGSGFVALGTRP